MLGTPENSLDKAAKDIKIQFKDCFYRYPNFIDLLNVVVGIDIKSLVSNNSNGTVVQNAHNRTSPVSFAGRQYEFNRGVISINYDGDIKKFNLDNKKLPNGNFLRHPHVTWAIANNKDLNSSYDEAIIAAIAFSPYELGMKASEKGFIIIQLEGDCMISFLPDKMSFIQLASLFSVLAPRQKFESHFCHQGRDYDDEDLSVEFFERKCIELLKQSLKEDKANNSTNAKGPAL